jgi:16S rRNA (adenine1518-N6/adenine1519-N6)-dimethyltransferase
VNLQRVQQLLRESGLTPKKAFGQNFLISESALAVMAEACVPSGELGRARVVEFGAGLGALTAPLVSRARSVIAVERDRDLVPVLIDLFRGPLEAGKLVLSESDAKSYEVGTAFANGEGTRVLCGNLPYLLTGPLLRLATRHAEVLDRVVFMMQQEVADRLRASPASKAYGALTVFVRAAFDVELRSRVPASAFYPTPKVSSAIVILTPVHPPRARETPRFRELVRLAFEMRRKTLRNAWRSVLTHRDALERIAAESGISLDARGETLSVEQFAEMAERVEATEGGTTLGRTPPP